MNKSLKEKLIQNGYDPKSLWVISKIFIESMIKKEPLPKNQQPETYVLIGCMAATCNFLSEINKEQLNKFVENKTIESVCNSNVEEK